MARSLFVAIILECAEVSYLGFICMVVCQKQNWLFQSPDHNRIFLMIHCAPYIEISAGSVSVSD